MIPFCFGSKWNLGLKQVTEYIQKPPSVSLVSLTNPNIQKLNENHPNVINNTNPGIRWAVNVISNAEERGSL